MGSRSKAGHAVLAPLVLWALAGCGEEDASVLVQVDLSEVSIPEEADSLCLGISDANPAGGTFGKRYPLEPGLVATLAVDPGAAEAARLTARIKRRGIEVDTASVVVDFGQDVAVSVARCSPGRAAEASERGSQSIATGSRVAISQGGGGTWIAAVADGAGQVFQAGAAGLEPLSVTAADAAGNVLEVLPIDVDGDCDDDLLVLEEDGPSLWQREPTGFVVANQLLPPAAAQASDAVAMDINGDLFADVALVGADGLAFWTGGPEGFTALVDPAGSAVLTGATGVASADLDGDGNLDLAVSRSGGAGQNDVLLYGNGSGAFVLEDGALPAALTQSSGVVVADIDGDNIAEVITVGINEPVRAYQRDAARSYVDRSFLLLPSAESHIALSVAAEDWNGDCKKDLMIAANESLSWASAGAGLAEEVGLPGAIQVLLADGVGNGEFDAFLVEPSLLRWWKR